LRNPQRITNKPRRARAPKQQKRSRNFNNKKIEHNGIFYDSQTEFLYHQHLLKDPTVKEIKVHPEFKILEDFEVRCKRCSGSGKRASPKTGKPINCTLCHGKRTRVKGGATYTADFEIKYIDGFIEICDVKGGPITAAFALRRRMFEAKTGTELIIVRLKNKEWVRE